MPDTAEVRALRQEITELKQGTHGLSTQVETLGQALRSLNDLQQAQREQRRELNDVKSVVVPRAEHERAAADRAAELRSYRRQLLSRLFLGAGIGAFVLLASLLGLVTYIDTQHEHADAQARVIYNNCLVRNTQAQALRTFLRQQTDIETDLPTERSARRITSYQELVRSYPSANCQALHR